MNKGKALKCIIHPLNHLKTYKYVVVCSYYNGKWVLSRHRNRDTYETQGGHIEINETPLAAAKRELYEESGITDADIYPVCDYYGYTDISHSNGMVFLAIVHSLGILPESEMCEVKLFDDLPTNLTYPNVSPILYEEAYKLYKSLNTIRYEFKSLDKDTINQLIELSRLWVEEDCSYGMVVNQESDLIEPLVVAYSGKKIVGYIFGHYYNQEYKTSYIEIGKKCFSIDELYVLPRYRGKGIGKTLFKMLEENVKNECSYITLSTSTKNYKSILKLYVEELGMNFHSAFLIKEM